MIGSSDMPPLQASAAADARSSDAGGLSDQECVERLQVAIADHAVAPPADGLSTGGQDDSAEAGSLSEVAALIGRLAVPLE
jgi:hypothetical protein